MREVQVGGGQGKFGLFLLRPRFFLTRSVKIRDQMIGFLILSLAARARVVCAGCAVCVYLYTKINKGHPKMSALLGCIHRPVPERACAH